MQSKIGLVQKTVTAVTHAYTSGTVASQTPSSGEEDSTPGRILHGQGSQSAPTVEVGKLVPAAARSCGCYQASVSEMQGIPAL